MPTLNLQHALLRYIQEINGAGHDAAGWSDWLPAIGCPVEGNDDEAVDVEVFPDRPDLLSHETIARAARSFLGSVVEDPSMEVSDSGVELVVDPSLAEVRPVILAAIVRGVDTGSTSAERDEFIQSLMDHQEKLHLTLGRKRRFSSIGVHDLSALAAPFRVVTVPASHSFVPLGMTEEMSIEQILGEHPKGMEYAHLMEELDSYPVILDSNDDILSFPPIINGDHTTVTEATSDFFIDVTGWDQRACEACLMLVCLSLAERGGNVESVHVTGHDGATTSTPRGDAREHRIPHRLIQKILGLDLGSDEIAAALTRMGGQLIESRTVTDGANSVERWADCAVGEQEHVVMMPRWRSDIMHPIDVVEDIAIGYGYDNMPEQLSALHLDAIPLKSSHLNRRARASLRALGIQETQSLTLSNERDQFELLRWPHEGGMSVIANPITGDHTMLRQYILPSLLRLLAANRHHELPQRVYELGTVVRDTANATRVAWACAEVGGGFTAAKGIAQALLRDLGAEVGEARFVALGAQDGPWIDGRGAGVMVSEEVVGQFGEVDPAVSHEFGLRSPIQAGEFDIDAMGRLIPDPVL
ncbi:phenylalanine--tRNA ligase subunit beta [Candidatus Thalassarchaeum betae]|uniref:phenylalanine--tRNA ligase subunit beta n=1 Tax=Candidatus Thalassarchaeum betae TaxID=2599289 RepID=UPI0030C70D98|nr:phenylalanine--tRNA ligase subunit beta [Candidatus Thalassoarchaea betae]